MLAWDFVSSQSHQGCWLNILSTPLCLWPQHCLACLEGHTCSKGCNYCQCSSVERATVPAWGWCPLRVTRATCRGQWSSVSAWLLQLTCVAPVFLPVHNQRIKGNKIPNIPLFAIKKNIPKNRLRPGLAADFFFRDWTPVDSKFEPQCRSFIACTRRQI